MCPEQMTRKEMRRRDKISDGNKHIKRRANKCRDGISFFSMYDHEGCPRMHEGLSLVQKEWRQRNYNRMCPAVNFGRDFILLSTDRPSVRK